VEKGILDLRGWNFSQDGLINLNGEWQFYWNKLIDPGGFKYRDLPAQTGYIQLPGSWNGYQVDGKELEGDGVATFRLEIRIDSPEETLALKVLDMATAYRIWVDETLVLSNGTVGKSLETMTPQFLPKVAAISTRADKILLTLQVSNFRHWKGGVWEPITLGTEKKIREKRERNLAFELFLFGSLLTIAFYHVGLFLFRPKEQSSLFFSLVCFWAGIREVLVGERFLISIFPGFNWEIFQKLEYLTFYLSVPFFLMFLVSLFPEFPKRLSRFVLLVNILFSLFTLVTPVRIFSHVMRYNQLMVVVLTVYGIYLFIRTLLNRRQGAIWIFLGGIILLATVFFDILAGNELAPAMNLAPFGLFFFVLFHSVMLSMRFSRAFTATETLSEALFRTNQQKDDVLSALKESEKKYRELVENMDDVFFTTDINGQITYVSPAANSVFGYDIEVLKQQQAFNYVVPEDSDQVMATIRQTIQGASRRVECRIVSRPGNVRWVRFSTRPMVAAGEIVGVQGIMSDITDRKRTQELMLQTEKMVSVGGLAAGMAHELNNPLAGILQAAQNIIRRLSSDLKTNVETAERCGVDLKRMRTYLEKRQILYYLAGIKESGERAAEIIKNMLHFSRKTGTRKMPVNIVSLLESTVELAKTDYDLKKNYDFRNIEIIREFEEGLPPVCCNKTEIAQVLYNLIKNAAQAMSGGPRAAKPQIILRLKADQDMVRIEIEDNGPGMTSAEQRRIFEPFFTTKPEGVGTGLGLSVSYMIISKNHQGTIEVESQTGKGTRFTILIPMESNPEPPPDQTDLPPG